MILHVETILIWLKFHLFTCASAAYWRGPRLLLCLPLCFVTSVWPREAFESVFEVKRVFTAFFFCVPHKLSHFDRDRASPCRH